MIIKFTQAPIRVIEVNEIKQYGNCSGRKPINSPNIDSEHDIYHNIDAVYSTP